MLLNFKCIIFFASTHLIVYGIEFLLLMNPYTDQRRQSRESGYGGSQPPDFEIEVFLITHIIICHICAGYFYGGGGGVVVPLKLIQLYKICIFIYIDILKSGPFYSPKILIAS